MTETFNEDVIINGQLEVNDHLEVNGQADEVQLSVKGHSSQNEALQVWENNSGTDLARVSGAGYLQVGDPDATNEALVEAHNLEDSAKPSRGFHSGGILNGTLSNMVSWIVQELLLKGTGGVNALHSALRVKLTNQNTASETEADMDGAKLRAGDFAIVNEGGSSGKSVPEMTGLHVAVSNQAAGYVDTAYGIKVEVEDEGQSEAVYAIHTGEGTVHVGGDLEVLAFSSSNPPEDPVDNGFLKVYVTIEEVGGEDVARLYAKGSGLSDSPQLLGGGAVPAGFFEHLVIDSTGETVWDNGGAPVWQRKET